MRTYLRDRTWLAAFVVVILIGCSSYVITDPSRVSTFLGWPYKTEPLEPTRVDPSAPWSGPVWEPQAPSAWPWVLLIVAILIAIPIVVWRLRGRAAAIALMASPVRAAKQFVSRRRSP